MAESSEIFKGVSAEMLRLTITDLVYVKYPFGFFPYQYVHFEVAESKSENSINLQVPINLSSCVVAALSLIGFYFILPKELEVSVNVNKKNKYNSFICQSL